MKIGVLALQGAFLEHIQMLKKLNIETVEIRNSNDLDIEFDGIIIPGGESTVMRKLLKDSNMFEKLKKLLSNNLPAFGTCAGLILLSKTIDGKNEDTLDVIDIDVKRNAYGRQTGSFTTYERFHNINDFYMTFIRAPYINKVGSNVEVLSIVDNKIVAARQNNIIVTAFHPEVDNDTRIHEFFIEMVKNSKKN